MRAYHTTLDVKNLRSLAIVGAAGEGQRLAHICEAQGIKIEAIVDDDPAKRELVVAGLQVTPVQTLAALPKSTPIVIASHRVLRVTQRLRELGFTHRRSIRDAAGSGARNFPAAHVLQRAPRRSVDETVPNIQSLHDVWPTIIRGRCSRR